jgi:hypothetical protein
LRVILCKYELEEDLHNIWALGVHKTRDVLYMMEEDIIIDRLLFNSGFYAKSRFCIQAREEVVPHRVVL